ncbi:MAG: bifunctional pyr operon transcriptional regulator/uracil phosphoribosyltransferase PyrR [Sandaracinaceae bacterium]
MPATVFVDGSAIDRITRRMALSIVDEALRSGARRAEDLGLVGIRRGGVPVAERLARAIHEAEGRELPLGTLDIALYRDDAATGPPARKIGPSRIEFDVRGRDVVLVDDVLQTGRTVRAAIDALLDYGRPRRIWLAVLFDRGGRELPIAPDFVGRAIELEPDQVLQLDEDDDGQLVAWLRGGDE